MGRISVFVIMAFLPGLAVGFFGRSARVSAMPQSDTRTADLAAIEKLHQQDIAATLSQDPKGLIDIWSDDAVRFNPAGLPAVGKQAIQAENEEVHAQFPGFKVLSYTPKYSDIKIKDGLACEWFERESEYKMSPDSPPASWHAQGLQVLKRQNDGSWKFALLIASQ
jgi:uncharacterized protein (TIGR02246 family)